MSVADRDTTSETVTEREKEPSLGSTVWGAICAFGLGAWVFYSLLRLENGEIESTRVWAPIAMLYQSLGFWPAVSLLPALGLFLTYKATSRLLSANDRNVDMDKRGIQ